MLVQHKATVAVPTWTSTTVTVVGDAIHSMPPGGGLGGDAALRTQRQGLSSNHITAAGIRACNAFPAFKPHNLPYREQARPRAWERSLSG